MAYYPSILKRNKKKKGTDLHQPSGVSTRNALGGSEILDESFDDAEDSREVGWILLTREVRPRNSEPARVIPVFWQYELSNARVPPRAIAVPYHLGTNIQ